RLAQLHERGQRGLADTALHLADERPVDVGAQCEVLLGNAARLALIAQHPAESSCDMIVSGRHFIRMILALEASGPRDISYKHHVNHCRRHQPRALLRLREHRPRRTRRALRAIRHHTGAGAPAAKGSIVVKKAYCDWERYKDLRAGMHHAGFELIEIPHVKQSGKNSADIRMVVDALDLCYTKPHVDTFVIISGDSDSSPLVSKLRENNKGVIGCGVKNSTSDLLIANCDEFIYYDDLVREQQK